MIIDQEFNLENFFKLNNLFHFIYTDFPNSKLR